MMVESSFSEKSIGEFLEALSRDIPTLPGGGCAAALLGALSASIEKFVLSVDAKKRKEAERNSGKDIDALILRLNNIKDECETLIDLDAISYAKVIRALRGSTPEQNNANEKKNQIRRAFKEALFVPEQLMACSVEMLEYGADIIEKCYKPLLADAGVAIEVSYSCFWAASWIARANLLEIADGDFVARQKDKYGALAERAKGTYHRARRKLEERLGE